MTRSVLIMALALAFVTGCLAASVAQNFVAPPVRAGTNPQKWEIMCAGLADMGLRFWNPTEAGEARQLNVALSEIGAEGWEPFVRVGDGHARTEGFCFKRPL